MTVDISRFRCGKVGIPFRGARSALQCAALLAGLAMLALPGKAAVIITHQGAADPTTENFGIWPFNGSSSFAALANDQGRAAWQITNTGPAGNQQSFYNQLGGTGPFDTGGSGLTQAEVNAISAGGFTMSLQARIVQGPSYSAATGNLFSIDETVAGFNGQRYDIALGGDGHGNTLVILPTLVSFSGGVFSASAFGTPLLVSGTGYHLYQLSFDAATGQASLYIDGTRDITGYTGSAVTGGATANNYGLAFGTANLATGNFAFAQLATGQVSAIPEPASAITFSLGLAALVACAVRRRMAPAPARSHMR